MKRSAVNTYPWLERDCLTVARHLLGWELVSNSGGLPTRGRIVEVEAYHGPEDPASHAFRGPTPRTLPMFENGGAVYVYLSYGVHACLNIVTGPKGDGQAVLIRALEPVDGLEIMMVRRHTGNLKQLCSGPGKLTQALDIGLWQSGSRLGQALELRPPQTDIDISDIKASPRIGISSATDYPWRFSLATSPFVSRP